MSEVSVVIGCMGQDGSYLCRSLLKKGNSVVGITKDRVKSSGNHIKLGIEGQFKIYNADVCNNKEIDNIFHHCQPNEIYNLAAQSSVGLSFTQPRETFQSIIDGTLNLLEISRKNNYKGNLFFAGSSEIFGETSTRANLYHQTNPSSPYGIAKETSFKMVKFYREIYRLNACTGILFNHESPLRPKNYVTQKIIKGALEASKNKKHKIKFGNLKIARDWGWAEEYIEAMQKIMKAQKIQDQVICTGELTSLREFIDFTFQYFDLNWEEHIEVDTSLFRKGEILESVGDPIPMFNEVGWKAKIKSKQVIEKLIQEAQY